MKRIRDILNNKFLRISAVIFMILVTVSLGIYFYYLLKEDNLKVEEEIETPEGLMLLIEFEDTVGLNNFVYQMYERDIPGLLSVSAEFVEENCEFIRDLQDYNIEIAGSYSEEPFWDMLYDEQYEIIKDTKDRVEACTGSEMRVVGSRYFAYDGNTLKVAEELGIEYVFARGTTGAQATIYKPDEYDVKIFSVSNIDSPKWGTGSLCDYSYWAREGKPEDFKEELYSAFETYNKVSPVSHTYIGGLKERWNEIYMDMFENLKVNWVNLDDFGDVDIYASIDDIPINREVQYTTPNPEISLDEETEIENPCSIVDLSPEESNDIEIDGEELIIFHNGTGPMCIEALEFLEDNDIKYTQYLTTDEDFSEKLSQYKDLYNNESDGVSTSFGYYPIIFYMDKAFSGFNDDISSTILNM
ncbi:MAG: hypothetical protein PHP08_01740 [Candidatus Dojkabacteria bacterium]|nr:hypothetical protein [Candidatus Dojkabacteria bacterium]